MNDRVYTDAEVMLHGDMRYLLESGIVLASENWHQGVIGIAASRLVEKYYLPTVLISLNNGSGKGSARSRPGNRCGGGCLRSLAQTSQNSNWPPPSNPASENK